MRKKWMYVAPLAIVGFALFVALGGAVVRLLWNALLPPLFGWPEVTFGQALGLLALCRILFGGLGGGHHRGFRRPGPWTTIESIGGAAFEHMTPEERERIRERLRERWGCGDAARAGEGR
jgi:hypothetical protein